MIIRSLVVAAMLCGAATASAGSLHKCKDAKGNVSYQGHACGGDKVSVAFTQAASTRSNTPKSSRQ